jgi:thiamine-phosphate pyrophosphorylase
MTICMVTDRHALIRAGASDADARACLIAQARFAIEGGVDLIQVRERDLEAAALLTLVSELLAIARGTTTRIVVNDRLDVALTARADGVHLRADSVPVAAARRLAPAGFLVGCSVHSAAEAAAAAGADYLVAGTVFPSRSKPASRRLLGVDGLRAVVSAASAPVLAIGGITAARLDAVVSAGAAGVAAIGLFVHVREEADTARCGAVDLRATVADLRQRFDSIRTAP